MGTNQFPGHYSGIRKEICETVNLHFIWEVSSLEDGMGQVEGIKL